MTDADLPVNMYMSVCLKMLPSFHEQLQANTTFALTFCLLEYLVVIMIMIS